jgi:hypothetical protein
VKGITEESDEIMRNLDSLSPSLPLFSAGESDQGSDEAAAIPRRRRRRVR